MNSQLLILSQYQSGCDLGHGFLIRTRDLNDETCFQYPEEVADLQRWFRKASELLWYADHTDAKTVNGTALSLMGSEVSGEFTLTGS
jgi:hypothetical protein